MDNISGNRCIYCGSTGPFNDEHVFSAGLGGDDNNYLLKNTVCHQCNSEVFKRFENEAFRRSPIAISRQFLQNHGRNRNKKTSTPGIITTETTILDNQSGEPLEARFKGKGIASILPQILLFPNSCCPTGENPDHLPALYKKMRSTIEANEVVTIEKITNQRFKLCSYSIDAEQFQLNKESEDAHPPKNGIWLNNPFEKMENNSQIARLYLDNDNLNLRISNQHSSDIPSILYRAFRAIPYFEDKHASLSTSTIVNPILSGSMTINIKSVDRTLVKNAINLITFLMGTEYINNSAFTDAKEFVLTGKGEILTSFTAKNELFEKLTSELPNDCHVIILQEQSSSDGTTIVVTFHLYGSGFHHYQIAKSLPSPPHKLPRFYVVHYNENIIETFTTYQFVQAHIHDFSKFHD